ncbi:MAG: DNA-directed RNA polymerase subunit B'' [Candidatus Micrarchaeia archaeon]
MANEIIDSYVTSYSLVQHQIESFNKFIDLGLQKIINKQGMITPNVEGFALKLGNVRVGKPSMTEADSSRRNILPNEARLRNLTYAAPIFVELVPIIRGVEKATSYGEVLIGEIPIMVKSNNCYLKTMTKSQLIENGEDAEELGGYFIIKGTERVLIGLEDTAPNKIITTNEKNGEEVVSKVFSTALGFRARCVVRREQKGNIDIIFPTISKPLPVTIVLRALGLQIKDIMDVASEIDVVKNDMMLNLETNSIENMMPAEAMMEIGKMSAPGQAKEYQQKRAETQIDTYLLPHLGIDETSRKDKGRYILEMIKKASLVANKYVKQDDKDHYANKRIRFAGELMEELFTYAFKFFIKDVKYQIERTSARGRKISIQTIINPDTLTDKIIYAMGTGTWVAGQTGISQVLDRTNLLSTYAHLRRIKSPLAKKHPHFKAREVHGTQWGKICPSETPEGQEVGLTKYLSIMAKVTLGADEQLSEQKIKEIGEVKE